MAYTLKLTNGRILLNLPDQTSDSVSTSLTLIGKNVNAYGTDINQNYIKILENFSNSVAPTSPLVGQIWYDSNKQQIKVYTINNEFRPVGTPIISASQPIGLSPGDMWYDTTTQQLKFLQAADNLVVIGPQNSVVTGKSGWVQEAFTTNALTTQTVESLYSNDSLIAILSDTAFTIASTTTSTNMRQIGVGITANYNDGLKVRFNGTATYATALTYTVGSTTVIVTATDFLTNTGPNVTLDYPLRLETNEQTALVIGSSGNFQFLPGTGTVATMFIGGLDEDFELKLNSNDNPFKDPVLHADGKKAYLGIFNSDPQADVDIGGNVIVRGDLTILGASSEIITEKLEILDKEILLAFDATGALTPSQKNTNADGSGIRVDSGVPSGTEFKWFYSSPATGAQNVWSMTDDLELRFSTSTYRIADRIVLSQTSLGPTIISAPGLTEIGELTSATIANMRFVSTSSDTVTYVSMFPKPSLPTTESVLVIGKDQFGSGIFNEINFGGLTLTNVSSPFTTTDPNVVATKGYVDSVVDIGRNQRAVLTIDLTGVVDGDSPVHPSVDDEVIIMLNYLLDPTETDFPYDTPDGTIVKVLITQYFNPQVTVVSNPIDLGIPVQIIDIDSNVRDVINYTENLVAKATFEIPGDTPLLMRRAIKQYQLLSGVWTSIDYPRGSGSGTNLIWPDTGLWHEGPARNV